jgi:hypothetical protein
LALRTGLTSRVIPNVMDFDNPPPAPDEFTRSVRADFGIGPDEFFFFTADPGDPAQRH